MINLSDFNSTMSPSARLTEVLAELGFTAAQTQALIESGVVRDGRQTGQAAG
jgi:hypothetical protein